MEEIYKRFNRPGAQKLYQLAKNEGLKITLNEVKEFLNGRVEEQQLKETKNRKEKHGSLMFSRQLVLIWSSLTNF